MKFLQLWYNSYHLIIRSSLRVFALIVLSMQLAYSGPVQAQSILFKTLSIDIQSTPIHEALRIINQKVKVDFIYTSSIELDKKVSISAKDQQLKTILEKVLIANGFTYETSEEKILIFSKNKSDQDTNVKGNVTDENGDPLPGVNVFVKGTKSVTLTDDSGNYTIKVSGEQATLVFSFMGFTTQEIPLGKQTVINVRLVPNSNTLSEVVVTALGIKREEKALGYTIQKLSSDEITNTPTNSIFNAMQGKVAGMQFFGGNFGPASSSRITLRGESTLDLKRNEALIVIDGTPLNNGTTGNGQSSYLGTDLPVDFGNGLNDINPDDIESITILKGASATALYGSRASNGAILVTTKKSKKNDKVSITLNSSVLFDKVNHYPDFQNEYGSGDRVRLPHPYYTAYDQDGQKISQSSHSWGPKFEGQEFVQYNSPKDANGKYIPTSWQAQDHIKGFFNTGMNYRNAISVSGGGEKGFARMSYTDVRNEWIIPNTGFKSKTLSLSTGYNVSKWLNFDINTTYVKKSSENLPSVGFAAHSPMFYATWSSNNVNVNWLKNYWVKKDVQQFNDPLPIGDNPYFQSYEQLDPQDKDRIYGNIAATVKFLPNLSLMVRSGLDIFNDFRQSIRPKSSVLFKDGMYKEQTVYRREHNNDFLLTYNKPIGKIETQVAAGGSSMYYNYKNSQATAQQLITGGVYNLGNSSTRPLISSSPSKKAINSLYGFMSLSYDNLIFVDVTGRNDWSSTLAFGNNSYFYPSVSSSFILSDIFKVKSDVLSYGKLRLSVAQVGNDTDPFLLDKYYEYTQFDSTLVNPTRISNPNLKPEKETSYEAGMDIRLFKNRIKIDAAVYQDDIRNQIVQVPIDPSSGFRFALMNAGQIQKKGIEVMAGAQVVKGKKFNWDVNINWARNRGKVIKLAEGVDTYVIAQGIAGKVFIEARPGERMGDIYGLGFKRSPEGDIIYKNGNALFSTDNKKTGNAFADWTGGIQNTFTYKGLSLGFLFDIKKGGDVYSLTHSTQNYGGKLNSSLEGRYDGNIVGKGVVENKDGTYSPNTVKPANIGFYYNQLYARENVEANTIDASYIKLRELKLQYQLNKRLFKNLPVNGVSISLVGRNLYWWANKAWNSAYDPEVATLDGNSVLPGIETAQFPSTGTYGFDIKFKF